MQCMMGKVQRTVCDRWLAKCEHVSHGKGKGSAKQRAKRDQKSEVSTQSLLLALVELTRIFLGSPGRCLNHEESFTPLGEYLIVSMCLGTLLTGDHIES